MKKLTKSSELLWVLGVVLVALGVSICDKANLGVSMIAAPAFVISEALLSVYSGFSVGVVEYIFQGLLLIILILLLKKFNLKYLIAFLVAVIYGYVLNFFIFLLKGVVINSALTRWVLLIIGDIVTAFGVASFFKTTYPLQVYELFVTKVASVYKFNINKVKLSFDMSLLFISIILAFTLFGDANTFDWSTIACSSFHSIGLGTLVTTIINSPIIAFASKVLNKIFDNKPLFERLEKVVKIS
ncbi:MAG: hypothetical protein J6Q58_05085 [Clostridia bacterium]|nr:hypothetical protein [Clostridia bacterium]